ncbi:MAG: molecular chaperone TorD family protein [Dehalococcoidia bacterium]
MAPRRKAKGSETGVDSSTNARSQVYELLARSFAFPSEDFYRQVATGRWRKEVLDILPHLPFEAPPLSDSKVSIPSDEFQAEYNRLFEVGTLGGPPCPLCGGHYERDRQRVMEELIRFYNYFGLSLRQGQLPDHISVELEFMHYLTFKEAEALRHNRPQDSYQRAQRDFLDRHLGKWLPLLRQKLAKFEPLPFFDQLVTLADELIRRERSYLKSILKPSSF